MVGEQQYVIADELDDPHQQEVFAEGGVTSDKGMEWVNRLVNEISA